MERTDGEVMLNEFMKNYILSNWNAFSDSQVIDICNAIISNEADDYENIIVSKSTFWHRMEKKPSIVSEIAFECPDYDPEKPLVYCDYFGDLGPDYPENDSKTHYGERLVHPYSMHPREVRSKVGPLALEILKTDFFCRWDEPWDFLLPALRLPTDMICNAFFSND